MKYCVDWILSGMESRLCRHERGIRLKERYSQGKISGKLKHRKAIGDRHKSLSLISYRKEAGPLQLYGMYVLTST